MENECSDLCVLTEKHTKTTTKTITLSLKKHYEASFSLEILYTKSTVLLLGKKEVMGGTTAACFLLLLITIYNCSVL